VLTVGAQVEIEPTHLSALDFESGAFTGSPLGQGAVSVPNSLAYAKAGFWLRLPRLAWQPGPARNLPTALAPGCTSQRYGLPTRRLGDEILPVSTLIKRAGVKGAMGWPSDQKIEAEQLTWKRTC